jgi:hypothetical protein
MGPSDATIRRTQIQELRAQLRVKELQCESLCILFEASMNASEKAEVGRRLDAAMHDVRHIRSALKYLENGETADA